MRGDSGGGIARGVRIARRLRENTEARVFLLEALALGWSFTFAARGRGGRRLPAIHWLSCE
jgi:hypothetical protein